MYSLLNTDVITSPADSCTICIHEFFDIFLHFHVANCSSSGFLFTVKCRQESSSSSIRNMCGSGLVSSLNGILTTAKLPLLRFAPSISGMLATTTFLGRGASTVLYILLSDDETAFRLCRSTDGIRFKRWNHMGRGGICYYW